MNLEEVFRYVDSHIDDMIAETVRCCSYRSVFGDEAGQAGCRRFLMEKMDGLGLETDQFTSSDGNTMLSGRIEGSSGKTLLIYNHYDVVDEGERALWQSDPFCPEIRNGVLYCRGASDNKGTLMARLQALEAIQATGQELPISLKFFLDGAEEAGYFQSIDEFRRTQPERFSRWTQADYGLWEGGLRDREGHIVATYGSRGNLFIKLEITCLNKDVHVRSGAFVPNAAWRMVWALASLKDVQEHILIDGFDDDLLPLDDADREALSRLPFDETGTRESMGFQDYLLGMRGEELKARIYLGPCINIMGIEAGGLHRGMRTVVPAKASAYLSVHLSVDQDPDKIYQAIRAHLDRNGFSDVVMSLAGAKMPPVRSRMDTPYTEKLISALDKVYDVPMRISPSMAGCGPQKPFRDAMPDLPMVGIGVANEQSGNHSPNENIKVEDYCKAIKAFAAIYCELGLD